MNSRPEGDASKLDFSFLARLAEPAMWAVLFFNAGCLDPLLE
jgi:hypothetical protein